MRATTKLQARKGQYEGSTILWTPRYYAPLYKMSLGQLGTWDLCTSAWNYVSFQNCSYQFDAFSFLCVLWWVFAKCAHCLCVSHILRAGAFVWWSPSITASSDQHMMTGWPVTSAIAVFSCCRHFNFTHGIQRSCCRLFVVSTVALCYGKKYIFFLSLSRSSTNGVRVIVMYRDFVVSAEWLL